MFRSNIQIFLVFIFFTILKSQNIDSELLLVNQYIDRGELKEAEIKLDIYSNYQKAQTTLINVKNVFVSNYKF